MSAIAGALTAAGGCAVLLGWEFDVVALKSVLPGLVTMKANSAVCFVLLGGALWLLGREGSGPRSTAAAGALAWTVAALAALTISEYLLGLELGIDQALFREVLPPGSDGIPGRMAMVTATAYLAAALALPLSGGRREGARHAAQGLALAAGGLGLLALIGYALGVRELTAFVPGTRMALHTAAAFLLLSAGLLALTADRGLMGIVTSPWLGGVMARRLLPFGLVLPIVLSCLEQYAGRRGFLAPGLAGSVEVFTWIISFAAVVLLTARTMNRLDAGRMSAEAALRASGEKYRTLFESSWDAMMTLFPPSGSFASGNPAAVEMFGARDEADFTSRSPAELSPELQPDGEASALKARRMIEEAMAKGGHYFEWTHRRLGGEEFPATVLLTRIMLEGRAGLQATVRDISRQKAAEAELQAALRRLRLATESAKLGIWEFDWETNKSVWDERMFEMHGVAPKDFKGSYEDWEKGVHPEDLEAMRVAHQAVFVGKSELHTEFRILRSDGEVRWLEAHAVVLRGPDGAPQRMIGMHRDITERVRTEEGARRLAQAMSQSPALAIITDRAGAIVFVNPRFTQVTGYRLEEVLGRNPRLLKSGRTPPETYRKLWAAILAGEEWVGELQNKRKDGSLFHVRATISPLRGPAGEVTGFLALEEDITAQKELELKLNQAQKMESVGRLAGGVAHDFNNLLTAISGYAQFLHDGFARDDARREDAREILSAVARGAQLTSQLLAFSRKQVVEPQVLDLNAAVAGTLGMVKRLIGEDITVETGLEPRPCLALLDAGQLDQLLVNLAVNARDAMPKGGTLRFETHILGFEEAPLAVRSGLRPGPLVRLSVSDTGCGMGEEVLGRIFEPFFTTKERGKGTGLGLAMVYGCVKQSGGEIEVLSTPERGSQFRVYLPQAAEAAPERAETEREAGPAARGSETLLLVEDEESIRRLARRTLLSHGYTVLTAADGPSALEELERRGGPVDLLITDVVMPGMSGRELALEVGRRSLARRTLLLSGYPDDVIAQQGPLEPGWALLAKPFSVQDLLRKVREAIDGPS